MVHTRVFLSNRTQAVRLPKPVALPETVVEVEITTWGDARLITPVSRTIDFWWESGERVSVDFLAAREQPPAQERGL